MKFYVYILIGIIILSSQVTAVEVLRQITPENPSVNDILEVKINIFNDFNSEITYEVEEKVLGDIELIDPKEPYEIRQLDGITTPILKWNVKTSPQQVTTIEYKIKPKQPGQLALQPVKLTDLSTKAIFFGDSSEIIIQCIPDGSCNHGENYLNCPFDCTSGAADGICNPIIDGICDSDCTEDQDCRNINSSSSTVYYIIAGIIFISIIVFIIVRMFNSRDKGEQGEMSSKKRIIDEKDPLSGINN